MAAFFFILPTNLNHRLMNKIVLLTLFTFIASATSFAQASASVSVTSRATVVEPIRIQKTLDLDFGNVIASQTAGSVVLSTDGTRTAYGVSISNAVPGQVNPAEAVVFHGDLSYDITLPESFILFNEEDPNQSLILNDFTVSPEPDVISEGSDLVKIGATLNMQANQVPGYYTNASGFSVTVTYN